MSKSGKAATGLTWHLSLAGESQITKFTLKSISECLSGTFVFNDFIPEKQIKCLMTGYKCSLN